MGLSARRCACPSTSFPEIDIPVVAVVWTYNGMSAEDIQNRILTLHERQLASLVDDISRIEAVSYEGVGVEKIYLHEGADVTRAVSQLASSALVVLKYMPPNITPPLVLRYGATDVPIIQLSCRANPCPTRSSTIWARTSFARRWRWCTAPRFPIPTAASRA
jgi:multidrug efflux pump subunit AcrB